MLVPRQSLVNMNEIFWMDKDKIAAEDVLGPIEEELCTKNDKGHFVRWESYGECSLGLSWNNIDRLFG